MTLSSTYPHVSRSLHFWENPSVVRTLRGLSAREWHMLPHRLLRYTRPEPDHGLVQKTR